MLVDIMLPSGSVWTAARGTVVEGGVGTFGTGIELMNPKGYFEKAFPTTRTLCIPESSYYEVL
jgi:hypothetical protein